MLKRTKLSLAILFATTCPAVVVRAQEEGRARAGSSPTKTAPSKTDSSTIKKPTSDAPRPTERGPVKPVSEERDVETSKNPSKTASAAQPALPTWKEDFSEKMEALLIRWEDRTRGIDRLRGTFQRIDYDEIYGIEKRSHGKYWYEKPDHGRMDFEPTEAPKPPKDRNPLRSTPDGELYRIKEGAKERWVCNGSEILQINDDEKKYFRVEIPPAHQGANVINSPLPFLFGMTRNQARSRYAMSFGPDHGKKDSAGLEKIHVIVIPKWPTDRQEYRRVEMLVSPESYLPIAIKQRHTSDTRETVYVFDQKSLEKNFPTHTILGKDPFKVNLSGYIKIVDEQAPPPVKKDTSRKDSDDRRVQQTSQETMVPKSSSGAGPASKNSGTSGNKPPTNSR